MNSSHPPPVKYYTLPVLLLIIMLGGCSLDYSGSDLAESIPEEVPDSVLTDYVFTSVQGGKPVYRIYAEKARLFHGKHEAHLEEVFFREFDAEGEAVTEGTADTAVVNTATDNTTLEGNLRFASSTYEAEIRAQRLFWNSEDGVLEGQPEDTVTIIQEDGTQIVGKGLTVHAPSRTIEFSGPVEGTYVHEEDEE